MRVISATEQIAEDSTGILIESILEGYAEYYSAELSEKVVRGLTENAFKCKYNGGGIPVGYVIDEEQYFQFQSNNYPRRISKLGGRCDHQGTCGLVR